MSIPNQLSKFLLLLAVLSVLVGCEGCQNKQYKDQSAQVDNAFDAARLTVDHGHLKADSGETQVEIPVADFSSIVAIIPGEKKYNVSINGEEASLTQEKISRDTTQPSESSKSYWLREYPEAELRHEIVSGPDGLFMRRIEDRSGFVDVLIIFDEPLLMCPISMSEGETRTQEVGFRVVRANNQDSQLDKGNTKAWLKYEGLRTADGLARDVQVHRFLYEMVTEGDNTSIKSRSILEFDMDGQLAREQTRTQVRVLFVNRNETLTRIQAGL